MAQADSVVMLNHDKIQGKVLGINNNNLTLHTQYAGDITIDIHYLAALKTNHFLWVRLKGQSAFKLIRFTTKDGKVWMNDKQGQQAPLTDSRSLARITTKKPKTGWVNSGNALLTFDYDDSSGDKESYGTKGQFTIKNPVNTHTFNWNTYYEQNSSKTTSRKWNLQYNYQRYLNASIYLQGNLSWAYALDQTPQSLISAGPSVGYQFWDNPDGSLQSSLGVNHLWEVYKTGKKQNEWALRWDLKYSKTFTNLVSCYEHIKALQPLRNGIILATNTGCKIQITDNFFVNAEYDYNYTTQEDPKVTVGSQRLSHIFHFGFGVNW